MDEDKRPDWPDGADSSGESAGILLRRAREAKGLSLEEIAAQTRIPCRHLEAIEGDDLSALPAPAYAVGFARTFARTVNADEQAVVNDIRERMEETSYGGAYQSFEPADPARVPPKWLAWATAAILLILAVGYGIWRAQLHQVPTDSELVQTRQQARPAAVAGQAPAAPAASGPVVLTANDTVWLRIYDEDGERLYEGQMAKGESFTVPAGANNPMILTGRPDALDVTVGGRMLPPLGTAERSITDFPISAEALLSRPAEPDGAQTQAPPAPATSPTPNPTAAGIATPARPAPSPSASAPPAASQTPTPARPASPRPGADVPDTAPAEEAD